MSTGSKNSWRPILSVLAGIGVAAAIAIPVALLAVLMGISDGKDGESRQPLAATLIIAGVVIGVFMAGYITATVSGTKKWWPILITAIILFFLFIWNADESISEFDTAQLSMMIAIIPLTFLGGWWGIKKMD